MLSLFTQWRLFHDLRVYSIFALVCCRLFAGGLPSLSFTANSGSAWNAMSAKSAWARFVQRLRRLCGIDELTDLMKTLLKVLSSYTSATISSLVVWKSAYCCRFMLDCCSYHRIKASHTAAAWSVEIYLRQLITSEDECNRSWDLCSWFCFKSAEAARLFSVHIRLLIALASV